MSESPRPSVEKRPGSPAGLCPVCGSGAWTPFGPAGLVGAPEGLLSCRHCRLVRRAGPVRPGLPSPPPPAFVDPAGLGPGARRGILGWTEAGAACWPDDGPYDYLVCHDAIGRAADPDAFAADLSNLMAPGGIARVTSPDVHHWRRPRNLAAWPGLQPESRSWWFGAHTLTRLLERHGMLLVERARGLSPEINLLARRR